MTSPWIFQLGSLAGVSTPAGRAQHIRAPAHPTAQAAGCGGQVGQPRWAPCRALESSGSTAGCFLSLQTLTLGRRGLSDLLQMVSRSHLLETLALVTGKPVAAVAGGGRQQSLLLSWCWQSNPCAPPRFSAPSSGVPSYPFLCCRSLWMVVKLRKQLRSPMAAFTRYVWGFVLEKGRLPLLPAGAPLGFSH